MRIEVDRVESGTSCLGLGELEQRAAQALAPMRRVDRDVVDEEAVRGGAQDEEADKAPSLSATVTCRSRMTSR